MFGEDKLLAAFQIDNVSFGFFRHANNESSYDTLLGGLTILIAVDHAGESKVTMLNSDGALPSRSSRGSVLPGCFGLGFG